MSIAELYSDETKGTQGAVARNSEGDERRLWNADDACCWCLLGALQKCYSDDLASKHFRRIEDKIGDIFIWNNDRKRTFAEVKSLVEELRI